VREIETSGRYKGGDLVHLLNHGNFGTRRRGDPLKERGGHLGDLGRGEVVRQKIKPHKEGVWASAERKGEKTLTIKRKGTTAKTLPLLFGRGYLCG